ncbi:MAG: ATP-dependent helicase HrpB [Elusimicrobia bacterium]|nr:ATP-dependent helicase HrpB [Elusimicrobiota bacterium]
MDSGTLVLTAPTGSGKSTQFPQFLLSERKGFPGQVLVLQPRRLAARALAGRVAAEAGTRLGEAVGYQVRFESRVGKDTVVLFQTYGVFLQRLLRDPGLSGVGAVLLDEFHERTLESDLSLAWLKALRAKRRPDLKLAIMSATLDRSALLSYLPGAAHVDVPGRLFPVEVSHLAPEPREDLPRHALRALRGLLGEGLRGGVLVFMPGMREIQRTITVLGPLCREHGLHLQSLHGSLELAEQQKVLDADAETGRVIVSTDVAETSLTIPGIRAVIDSGWHRLAGYSPQRGINTLYLSRISRASAAQRAGRAGRTGPGRCVRLWSLAQEASMPQALAPETLRLELSAALLRAAALGAGLDWLTPPPEPARHAAERSLLALGALADGKITRRGQDLLRYPVSPRLAAALLDAQALDGAELSLACAMAAVLESPISRRRGRTADLSILADDLRSGRDEELPWEAGQIFRQLERLSAGEPGSGAKSLPELWLKAYADRLAARQGESGTYRLIDGRRALLPLDKGQRFPRLILALEVEETAGSGQSRQISVPVYLPCEPQTVRAAFPKECAWKTALEFDETQRKVLKKEQLLFRGLALESKEAVMSPAERKAAAAVWAEKFASGELAHPGRDEKFAQLLARVAIARRLYPDMGFPAMDADDWRLIYEEACQGRNSWAEVERVSLEAAVGRYLGASLAAFLDQTLPLRRKLPSGRTGKFLYFETQPPEFSARLADFWGFQGTLNLCEGRLPVTFDILSPAFRTVQKTQDLDSFWQNAYPKIKKELQGKYPRHLWP